MNSESYKAVFKPFEKSLRWHFGNGKLMLNAVKLDSKPRKKRFRPYFLNSTSDQSKITPKCSKIKGKCRKSFKANKEMFSLIPWQRYIRSTQNINKNYSKMKYKCRKSCFKADKETFSHVSVQR